MVTHSNTPLLCYQKKLYVYLLYFLNFKAIQAFGNKHNMEHEENKMCEHIYLNAKLVSEHELPTMESNHCLFS